MKDNIVLEITEVANRQKTSKSYNIKLATLIVGILVLCSLTVARIYDLPNEIFLGGALLVLLGSVFVYNLPGSADRKFMKPYVDKLSNRLEEEGYHYKDKQNKKNLMPWFSNHSRYLYGKGLSIAKDPSKGLAARKLSYVTDTGENLFLSVERLATGKQVLLQVIQVDENGNPMPVMSSSKPRTTFNDLLTDETPIIEVDQSVTVPNNLSEMEVDPAALTKPKPVPNVVLPPPVILPPK